MLPLPFHTVLHAVRLQAVSARRWLRLVIHTYDSSKATAPYSCGVSAVPYGVTLETQLTLEILASLLLVPHGRQDTFGFALKDRHTRLKSAAKSSIDRETLSRSRSCAC